LHNYKKWWMLYRMGYFSNQSGIMRRFLREEGAWEEHLKRSRDSILSKINTLNPKTVAILGSGWLLDIPLNEMLDAKIRVKLIDIAHPTRIVYRYRKESKVEFIDHDVTGGVPFTWNLSRQKKNYSFQEYIEALEKPSINNLLNVDLVLSINILSQLHLPLVEYLLNRNRLSDDQVKEIILAVQNAHIDILPEGKSLLIADYEEELYDDRDKLVGVNQRVLADTSQLEKEDGWKWKFDTKRMYSGDQKVILNVAAYWKK